MILFDKSINDTILIDDIKVNSNVISNINSKINSTTDISITLNIKYIDYVKSWFSDMFTENRYDKSKYIRDIFVCNKVDMMFVSCYPTSWSENDVTIELDLTCDYCEIGGNFPELKVIYRDRKIDELLN